MTDATPGLPRGRGYVVRSGLSDWSLPVIAQLPKRPSAPAGVTIGIQAALESLILTWQSPTTLADGTPLKVGALFGFIVYWSKTAGIDIDNPATYLGKEQVDSERYVFTVPDPSAYLGPYHFVVTAVDTEGTQSLPSAEVTATASRQGIAPPFADDWATGNAEAILAGKGRIFVKFRLPKSTWSGSAYYKIYTDIDTGAGFSGTWTWLGSERIGFMHSPLNEAHKFRYKVTVVDENGIETTGTIHDNVGLGYQPNQANQGLILADTVAAQNMIAQYDMIAQTFVGGVLQSVNWGGAAGTQFDLDGGTFQIGGSTAPKLSWDGTTLSVVGAITIQSGSGIANLTDAGALATRNTIASTHIDASAVTTPKVAANAITADKINVSTLSAITANMGTLTAGTIRVPHTGWRVEITSGTIPFRYWNGSTTKFQLDNAGNLEITGALIAGAGSSLPGGYLTPKSVIYGKLAVNSVRADELYIDRDINFMESGIRQGCVGIEHLFYTSTKDFTKPNIQLGPTNIHINAQNTDIILFSKHTIGCFKWRQDTIFGPATAPTTWTMLDLSAIVGSRDALVLIQVHNHGSDNNYRFRPAGTVAAQHSWADAFPGAFSTRVDTIERFNWVWCMTNHLGQIEWDSDVGTGTTLRLCLYFN